MSWRRVIDIVRRTAGLPARADRELEDEIRFHLAEEARLAPFSAPAAERRARRDDSQQTISATGGPLGPGGYESHALRRPDIFVRFRPPRGAFVVRFRAAARFVVRARVRARDR